MQDAVYSLQQFGMFLFLMTLGENQINKKKATVFFPSSTKEAPFSG